MQCNLNYDYIINIISNIKIIKLNIDNLVSKHMLNIYVLLNIGI